MEGDTLEGLSVRVSGCFQLIRKHNKVVRVIERVGLTCGRLLIALCCSAALFPALAQTPSVHGLVNAATGRSAYSIPVAARGSIVSIFGTDLAAETIYSTVTVPGVMAAAKLSGSDTQVFFGGVPAPLFLVSPVKSTRWCHLSFPTAILWISWSRTGTASAPTKSTCHALELFPFSNSPSG